MRIKMMGNKLKIITVVAVLVALISFGCVRKTTGPPSPLTAEDALRLADSFAKDEIEVDLANYPNRTADYEKEAKTWSVLYHREPNRWPGDHFMITIDEQTREAEIIPGL